MPLTSAGAFLLHKAITGILPLNVVGNLVGIAFLFHHQNFTENSSLMSLFSIS